MSEQEKNSAPVIELRGLDAGYAQRTILKNVNFNVNRGEILAIVGGSGSGKSTLLRVMLMLAEAQAGSVRVFGERVENISEEKRIELHRRMGTLFQYSALFGALTLEENIAVPLEEHTDLGPEQITEIAKLKIALVGLDANTRRQLPNELSGGMRKRAALARALALDPELLLLDEPHSGLDPQSSDELDDLIMQLRNSLGLTVVMVTHDMSSCWRISDRVALLGSGRLLGVASMHELAESKDPDIQAFFRGPRAHAAQAAAQEG